MFEEGEIIPSKYTCDGERFLSPSLSISDVPEEAQSLLLIVDDPDVPKEIRDDGLFTHWMLFNIPPNTTEIPEGGGELGEHGSNTRGEARYTGPCPPPEYEPREHRYFFKLYALDTMLDIQQGASREEVEAAMGGHLIAQAELMGRYSRS